VIHEIATAVAAIGIAGTAALFDARTGRIPNAITLPAFALGVTGAALVGGGSGIVAALFGAMLAAIVPALLFRAGAMGGGDLKLFAALGCLCGPRLGLEIETAAFCFGAVQGIAVWARSGMLRHGLAAAASLAIPWLGKRWRKLPHVSEAAKTTIRLGPAIALGTFAALVLWLWG
jgi:prepilin peptidase CpaA